MFEENRVQYFSDPDDCHEHLLDITPGLLRFDPEKDFQTWKKSLHAKFLELIGDFPQGVPLNIRLEYTKEEDLFIEKRFIFTSEKNTDVPCHLLIPRKGQRPFPVVICLQGHNTGMHLTLGRVKYEGDDDRNREGDRDTAIQAVRQGYAALVLEQRCFGERKDVRHQTFGMCSHASLTALILGRTMLMERAWDVSKAIDALEAFDEIDCSRIACYGNSGGGKTSYYAACLDPRISITMPSCSVCSYAGSLARKELCHCTYIPGVLKYFDMAELSALIAPRPLIVISGEYDEQFEIEIVKKDFEAIRGIYEKAGAASKCRHIIGKGGHSYYADLAWPAFREMSGW